MLRGVILREALLRVAVVVLAVIGVDTLTLALHDVARVDPLEAFVEVSLVFPRPSCCVALSAPLPALAAIPAHAFKHCFAFAFTFHLSPLRPCP